MSTKAGLACSFSLISPPTISRSKHGQSSILLIIYIVHSYMYIATQLYRVIPSS